MSQITNDINEEVIHKSSVQERFIEYINMNDLLTSCSTSDIIQRFNSLNPDERIPRSTAYYLVKKLKTGTTIDVSEH